MSQDPKLLQAAAYQVLAAKVHPFDCFTEQRQKEIHTELDDLSFWIIHQTTDVRKAYYKAIEQIKSEIAERVKQTDFSNNVSSIIGSILPVPP